MCRGISTRQSPVLCRVPVHLHTANNGPGHCFVGFFAMCHGKCTRHRAQFRFIFLSVTYMVPQALQAFHIYHNKHFMYPKKHRRHFILSRNAQMQRNSSIVHRQPQVVHTSPYNSPYKFMSLLIKSIQLTGTTVATAVVAGAAATSAGAAM